MTRLSPADLWAFMQQHGIPGEIQTLDVPTPTVEAAARAVGARPGDIVKSILFLVEDRPVLAIACGSAYVDRRAIALLLGVGRKRVKLADPKVVLEVSGYEVGAMPPFGHLHPLQTLIDPRVLKRSIVWAGGGAENTLLRLDPGDLLRASAAQEIDLLGADETDRLANHNAEK